MIAGVAVVPTAPLLVDGVSAALPADVAAIASAATATLASLPSHDVQLLITATAPPGGPTPLSGSLAGIGRPDLVVHRRVDSALATTLAATGLALADGDAAALDQVVLLHLIGPSPSTVVPLSATATTADAARHQAARLLDAVSGSGRIVVIGAGDLSAGVGPHAPLAAVDGARQWNDCVVAALRSGQVEALGALGPDEAARVGARGWASLLAVAALCERLGRTLTVDCYGAPRGVGYLVAHTATASP